MPQDLSPSLINALGARLQRIEQAGRPLCRVLPFESSAIDTQLPDGGLAVGGLHEITAAGNAAPDSVAATLFAAGILARRAGPILWCSIAHDLFAPRLDTVGLSSDRLIFVEAGSDKAACLLVEEGLRHGGFAGVVGEIGRLPLAAARRLQRAAEVSHALVLTLRRGASRTATAATRGAATRDTAIGEMALGPAVAVTRWRIAALVPSPSSASPSPGSGSRGHWRVNLIHCRGGEPASWIVEGCSAEGRLTTLADPAEHLAVTAVAAPAIAGTS